MYNLDNLIEDYAITSLQKEENKHYVKRLATVLSELLIHKGECGEWIRCKKNLSSVKVLGIDVGVEVSNKFPPFVGVNTLGRVSLGPHYYIWLREDTAIDYREDTLLHEVLHVVFDLGHINLGKEEEDTIGLLSTLLVKHGYHIRGEFLTYEKTE